MGSGERVENVQVYKSSDKEAKGVKRGKKQRAVPQKNMSSKRDIGGCEGGRVIEETESGSTV
jgi:hypothetical protein